MNTCKDCKWWEKRYEPIESGVFYFGTCGHPKLNKKHKIASDTLYAWEDNPITTGEDFGCVHFNSKNERLNELIEDARQVRKEVSKMSAEDRAQLAKRARGIRSQPS